MRFLCARRELADALEVTEEKRAKTAEAWRQKWSGLRRWFIGENGPSQANLLRARARAAIPALLATVSNLNDRRTRRADRATDFLVLARWFAEAPDDEQAHRLWHAAFGLGAGRSLRVNDETLDNRATRPESPRVSWLEAEPLWIAPRLRTTGRTASRAPAPGVVDHSRQREALERLAAEEIRQIDAARARLATGHRLRLAEMETLDTHAFHLFLDLLGDALSRKSSPAAPVETSSADGALTIRLEPTPDGRTATLATEIGDFHGRDHWITIAHRHG